MVKFFRRVRFWIEYQIVSARYKARHAAMRKNNRRVLQEIGPQGVLEVVKKHNEEERQRFGDGCEGLTCVEVCERWKTDDSIHCDVWMAISHSACVDAAVQLLGTTDKCFEEAVFLLPGFVLAGAIHENVLRGYIHLLLGRIWSHTSHEHRDVIATELIQMFQRRHSNPVPWDRDG